MSPGSYRLDSPLPDPATGAEARTAARRALALCPDGAADGDAIFTNTALNAALDPLRLHPALGVRCGSCGTGIAYIALNTQGAYVVSANNRQTPKRRRGGIYDLDNITTASGTRNLPGWQEDAAAGRGTVTPTGERSGIGSGLAERRTHSCPRCNATYTHTNTTLLQYYLEAISRGGGEVLLK